ncbi:MAG: hypothetical protein LUC91_11310, partial [Prevotella sp.]|nr:hypothetical protein [Prevotella sp.]
MKYILTITLILFTQNMFAQFATSVIDEMELQFKVKQIDEFMHRFNYDITYDGTAPINKNDSLAYRENRTKNMMTLFNLDIFMDDEKNPNKEMTDFIEYVIDNNCKLNYEDSTWYAKLKCNGDYAGQKQVLYLFLRVERIKGVEYKWVCFDVNGKIFDSMTDSIETPLFISPAEHGIGFMTLPDIINSNTLAIATLDYKSHKNDALSVFNYLVANKSLKISS